MKDHKLALCVKKRDAEFLGLHGEGVGDVVLAIRPGYGGDHHGLLPTGVYETASTYAIVIMSGPGIKINYRRERAMNLVDLAPTIAKIIGIPEPAQAEGRVIRDFLI